MTTRECRQPDGRSTPIERVLGHSLPGDAVPLIESYERVVGDRDRFLWKWAHHLFPKLTLSCLPPEDVEPLRDAKLLGLIFVSTLDDVAEKHRNRATFEEAAKIPFDHQSADPDRAGVDRDVLTFASEVWNEFAPTLRESPRATEFEAIVRFDLKQVLNSMEYSHLANQHVELITEADLRTYDVHNMMLYGFADIDLVHSLAFDRSELSTLRRVVARAQRMVRIGNWVTTWEREILEGDFTSGVVAYALEHDIVSIDDLRASRAENGAADVERVVASIRDHDVEDVFLGQWHAERTAAREFEGAIESVDVGAYLDGIETVMEYHLASRGLK